MTKICHEAGVKGHRLNRDLKGNEGEQERVHGRCSCREKATGAAVVGPSKEIHQLQGERRGGRRERREEGGGEEGEDGKGEK